jgi:hypothetical protein
VVSSAIVDKYIGESARVIREMFGYARDHQPCVIFMDEIDAIGGRRFSEGTSADREIQRTLMELLSQLDGFDVVGKVRQGKLSGLGSSHSLLKCMAPGRGGGYRGEYCQNLLKGGDWHCSDKAGDTQIHRAVFPGDLSMQRHMMLGACR